MRRMSCLALLAAVSTIAAAAPSLAAGTSTIEGRWKTKRATLQQLLAAGFRRKDAEALAQAVRGTPALDLENGVFKGLDLSTGRVVATGTYRLTGNVIRFVFKTGVAVQLGQTYALRWSVYRDRLTFSSVPARPSLAAFTLNPWTRVR
jgi:hypothetical protein